MSRFHRSPPSRSTSPRRRRSGFAGLLALLLATTTLSCHRQPPPAVIWIVVDTLRADHLEWYGYGRQTTPALRPLLDHGVLFENVYTPQPETTPAISSMFTGLYPVHHGVNKLYTLLHDDNSTAAERFAAGGYDTAAFVSSFVMMRRFSNLGQGFRVYDDYVTERELYRENYERKASVTLARVRRWLLHRDRDRDREKPLLLFVHLIDPHGPYAPPEPFAHRYHSDTAIEVQGDIPSYQQIPGVRDLNRYRDLYDGEVAFADHELGGFIDLLRQRGLFDDALVVFTADHGESMGEHGKYFHHGSDVYQENLHVPLIVKPPRGFRIGARRVSEPVSSTDLLPTVLELAGLPVPEGIDGRSLVPALRGERLPRADVFAHGGRFVALVDGRRKTVWNPNQHQVVTYDLVADPAERTPLPADAAVAERLRQAEERWAGYRLPFAPVRNFLATSRRGRYIRQHVDPALREDEQRLKSLGYL